MPATKQPKWEFVANLGDLNPLDYGGYFLFRDRTGVYPPEAEKIFVNEEADTYDIYRVILDPLKLVDGWLVPRAYQPNWPHPVENYDAWFHKNLAVVADHVGRTYEDMLAALTSDDIRDRAYAYENIFDYHGWENGDSEPLTGLTRSEVRKRYRGILDKFGRVKR